LVLATQASTDATGRTTKLAAWAAAARAEESIAVPRSRSRPRVIKRERRVTGGVFWIGIVATLLAGVVATNVAVLRLNMRLDSLGRERADLRAQNAELSSQLSSAASAPRIQKLAAKQLGWVQATPDQTTYFNLGH
jgi:cell division protein FtsL